MQDPALLPALVLVRYEVPEACAVDRVDLGDLPLDRIREERLTQRLGDAWLASGRSATS